MRTINFSNSVLLIWINPKTNKAKCVFIYFINWYYPVFSRLSFDLNVLNINKIVNFYKTLSEDYDRKYQL